MAKGLLLSVCGLAIVLSIFASGLRKPLGHDENMYCTAGALMAQGKMIYRDFAYVAHPPCHPLLLSAIYKLLNTNHYLLVARFISIICDCLVAVIIFLIYRSVFAKAGKDGTYFGLAAAVLYAFNPFVNYAGGFAWNHSIILLCSAASFWIYTAGDDRRYLRIAAIAALLTFATFSRITTFFVWLLFFIFLLFEQGPKFKAVLTFLLVSLLVALWPLYIIAQAPQAFYLDVVTTTLLNGRYLHEIGMAYSKPRLILGVIAEPIYAVTILIGICLWITAFIARKNFSKMDWRNMILAVLLTIISVIIALTPATAWEQYFAMPVLFLIISLAYPLAKTASGKFSRLVGLAAAIVAVLATVLNPLPLAQIPPAVTVSNWVPMQVHAISEDIAAKVGRDKQILTLAPIFAIEGGCQIYPELAAGPFAYRVADSMSAEDRITAKVVGMAEIGKLAENLSPSGLFLGTEPSILEEPLRKIAPPEWKIQTYLDGRLILLFEPQRTQDN